MSIGTINWQSRSTETHKANRSLIVLDPSSNPMSFLGNGVVDKTPLTPVEDCAVLAASVKVVFLFGFALLSLTIRDGLGLEKTPKVEFVASSEISIPCGVVEANFCLSRRTSSSRSDILL